MRRTEGSERNSVDPPLPLPLLESAGAQAPPTLRLMNFRTLHFALLLTVAPVCASEVTFLGNETVVNVATTEGSQNHATVAINAAGRTLVVWNTPYNGSFEVRGRFFDGTGGGIGEDEFAFGDPSPPEQVTPDVSTDGGSRFVVVWSRESAGGLYDVFCSVLNDSGDALVAPFRVNTTASISRTFPDVSMRPDGSFAVVGAHYFPTGQDVMLRGFDASGNPDSAPIRLNARPNSVAQPDDSLPDISTTEDGKAVVAWTLFEPTKRRGSIVYRMIDMENPGGIPGGSESHVLTATSGLRQVRPNTDIDSAGNALVVWNEEYLSGRRDVRGRKFTASSNRWEPAFRPYKGAFARVSRANARFLPDGGWLCGWEGTKSGGSTAWDLYMRGFDAAGRALSNDVRINSQFLTGNQVRTAADAVPIDGKIRVSVTFESDHNPASEEDICLRAFEIVP